MCGIVGYIGERLAAPILLDGLQRLEYRGYDSAGIAVLSSGGELVVKKSVGKLANLMKLVSQAPPRGSLGAGHTRWATHGKPSEVNAHPHLDCAGEVVVIHNGIVENYLSLKAQLQGEGHRFVSQTDTEVIPHLVERYLRQGMSLEEAVAAAAALLEGGHAIVVLGRSFPDRLVAARVGNAGGVVIGCGEGEMVVSSDLPAILPHTQRAIFLENREVALVRREGVLCRDSQGQWREKAAVTVPYDPIAAAKGGYRHFMLKEIMEQSRSLTDVIRGRAQFDPPDVLLDELPLSRAELRGFSRAVVVACGTSWHACLAGKFMLEELACLPTEVDYGSEFRYRKPLLDPSTLFVSVTQSGETVDTLAAMNEAKERGVKQITFCNVIGSEATRVADGVLYLHAGPEIGVASTKAFTSQLVAFYLLAAYLGKARGWVNRERMTTLVEDLARLPQLAGALLERDQGYEELARRFFKRSNFLYLARGINYPIALEGALKLKEISYIHAEGYPAGEMKHGPIALIDEKMPVVAIAVQDGVYDKMVSNIEQVKTRDGIVIALASEGDEAIAEKADYVIRVPRISHLLTPVLAALPLQLFAYHMAVRRGCDVDQPRNLAKSVTVE